MSGPFVDLPLTTGQYFTQTRQRQMNTNSKVAWERTADGLLVPYDDYSKSRDESSTPTGNVSLTLEIDTSIITSTVVTGGTGDVKFGDIDISAIGVGLHTLQLKAYASAIGGFAANGKIARFVKHEYMNRMTVWARMDNTIVYNGINYTQTIALTSIAIITHESDKSW